MVRVIWLFFMIFSVFSEVRADLVVAKYFDRVATYNQSSGVLVNGSFINAVSLGVVYDGAGNLYVSDYLGNKIGKYDASTGNAIDANFVVGLNGPAGLALDGSGNLYVANLSGTVGKYNANTGNSINPSLVSGIGSLSDIAVDSSGNLFVCAYGGSFVGKYDSATGNAISPNFINGLGGTWGIELDGLGAIYVTQYGNNIVGKYSASDGAAINPNFISGLSSPYGLTIDSSGDLYIGQGNGRVGIYSNAGVAINANLIASGGHNAYSLAITTGIVPSAQTVNGTVGTAITPTTALTATGFTGTVTYSVSPPLPTNLLLNASDGVISGTPAAAQSTTTYTITGTDGTASATATVDITVVAPPYSITPSSSTVTGTVGTAIAPVTFADSGFSGSVTYSINPGLPNGLSLNTSSGEISGTPQVALSSTNYTITGTDGTNSATAAVSITIGQGTQFITFGTTPTPIYLPNGTFSVSATTTSGLPITYSSLTSSVCTVSGSTVTMLTAGTCTIAANQAGNSDWTAASQATQDITIGIAPQVSCQLNLSSTTIQSGQSVTLSTTGCVGTVTYTAQPLVQPASATSSVGIRSALTCPISGNILTPTGGPGVCQVTANATGDFNYDPAIRTGNVTVQVPSPPPNPIPTLSDYAKMLLALLLLGTMGWQQRRAMK